MKKGNILKKISALFLTVALALAPMTSALATNNDEVDFSKTDCSITVHKYLSNVDPIVAGSGLATTDPNFSAEEAAALAAAEKAGAGIKFSLYKVNLSEVTESTTVAQALVGATLISEKATDQNGDIEWAGLAVGYYVLVEDKNNVSSTPAGTVPDNYSPSPDSIIAVPYAVDDNAWNYNVHVYPKNVSDKELVKENELPEKGYAVGDTVDWKFTGKVNITALYKAEDTTTTPVTPEAFGTYSITDALDSRLDFDVNDITTAGKMSVEGVVSGGTNITLDLGTDVTCTYTANSHLLTWTLTEAGIRKLAAAKATGLEIAFKTTINNSAYGAGSNEINNGGKLEWENSEGTAQTPYEIDEEDKPIAKLYNLIIDKVDGTTKEKLNGARFKIALTEADAIAGRFLTDINGDVIVTTANHIITPGNTVDGWAMFAGLPVTASQLKFYLVEITAPTVGTAPDEKEYVRNMDPIEVDFGSTATLSKTATINNFLPDDPNIPSKWKLPLTGGTGTVLFYVIGTIIMLGCAVVFVKSRKAKAGA